LANAWNAHSLWQDIRFGARMLLKNPGFTLAAILSLALGIGGNVAVFSITSALLLRPFPYRQPQQLLDVEPHTAEGDQPMTLMRYELVRDHNQSFSGVAVYTNDNFNLTGHGEPLQVPIARISPNFFALLGVQPELGRTFTEDEGRPEGKPVVMITDALWHSRFGGDRNVIGQSVTLNTVPHTVIGVLPPNLELPFLDPADVWTPRYFEYSLMSTQRLRMGVGYLGMIARLKPKVSLAQAQAELAVLNQQYRQQNPTMPDADAGMSMVARPLRDLVVSNVRMGVIILSAAIGLVGAGPPFPTQAETWGCPTLPAYFAGGWEMSGWSHPVSHRTRDKDGATRVHLHLEAGAAPSG
jgi:hypothetical protein